MIFYRKQHIMNNNELERLRKDIDALIKIQCSDGNWNCDSYMHGLANGMLLIQAMVNGVTPDYLSAPTFWLSRTYRTLQKLRTIWLDSRSLFKRFCVNIVENVTGVHIVIPPRVLVGMSDW